VGTRFIFTIKMEQQQRERQIMEIGELVEHECNTDELVFKWRPDNCEE